MLKKLTSFGIYLILLISINSVVFAKPVENGTVVRTAAQAETVFKQIIENLQSNVILKSAGGLDLAKEFEAYWDKTVNFDVQSYSCKYSGNTYNFSITYNEEALALRALKNNDPIPLSPKGKYIYTEVKKISEEIIKKDMTDYQKVKAIHDYLVLNTAYDEENLKKGTIPKDSYSAYGLLKNRRAVCQGYALAFKLFLEYHGIEAYIVDGTGNGDEHAWNKIKLDGQYYNVDVTWDDPVPDKKGEVSYSYFNISDEMLAADHSWDKAAYPKGEGTKYYYYNYEIKSTQAATAAQFDEELLSALKRKDTEIAINAAFDIDESFAAARMKNAARKLNIGLSYYYKVVGKVAIYNVTYK